MKKGYGLMKLTASVSTAILTAGILCGTTVFAADSDTEYLLITQSQEFSQQDQSNSQYIYEYTYEINEDGSARKKYGIQSVLNMLYEGSCSVSLHTYEYDSDGTLGKENLYDSGQQTGYILYEYDSDGNLTEADTYDEDGGLYQALFYEYDQDGNMTQEAVYLYSELSHSFCYEYDSDGNIISYIYYDSEGSAVSENTYEYNQDGELTSLITYDSEGNATEAEYVYEYDEDGKVTKRSGMTDGVLGIEEEFDEGGNLTKITNYTSGGEVLRIFSSVYMSVEDYASSLESSQEFDSYEEVVEETLNAAFQLDAERIWNMMPEDLLIALMEVNDISKETLIEQLSDEIEISLDKSLKNIFWEYCEPSWDITAEEEYTSEELEALTSELGEYPQIAIEKALRLETEVTVTPDEGEAGTAIITVSAALIDGSWYSLGLEFN
ncbi:MAG: hypothetical protein LUH07_13020 [Lachnospiraceae bacterium]|nr:hypothetical protein [Lachnospiraceae bacterium]